MHISRISGIAPVSPVHPIYKDPPKYQPEFKKDKKKLKDAEKDAQDAFESILEAENLIKETNTTSPQLKALESKVAEIEKVIKAYKENLRKTNDDLLNVYA